MRNLIAKNKSLAIGAGVVVAILLALFGFTILQQGSQEQLEFAAETKSSEEAPVKSAEELMADCDRLAAMPGDPMRAAAPVADDAFAPVAAIAACEAAVAANPGMLRAQLQLGRALMLGNRIAEARDQLIAARDAGSGAASYLLGILYRDGKLPEGGEVDLEAASRFFQEAFAANIEGAQEALLDVQREIERSTLDKSLFQNGDYIEALYTGKDIRQLEYPLAFVYYMQGLASGIDDEQVIFIDQACKSMVSKVGVDVLGLAEPLVAVAQSIDSTDGDGNWTPEGVFKVMGASFARDYIIDQGKRDATVLFNEDGRYGCRSPVTEKILSNMMLVIRNNS